MRLLISSCLVPLTLLLARSVRVARALMRRSLERHEAVGLDPTDPMLQLDLGLTLARTGQLDAADSTLALVEAQLPRYAMVANDVGTSRGSRGIASPPGKGMSDSSRWRPGG
jgi:hypothetical protein